MSVTGGYEQLASIVHPIIFHFSDGSFTVATLLGAAIPYNFERDVDS
jgi:hypothetical protein